MLLKSAYLATLREKIQALKKEYSSLQWMGNRVESVQRRRAMLHEQLSVLVRLHRHLHAIHQNVQTGNKKQALSGCVPTPVNWKASVNRPFLASTTP